MFRATVSAAMAIDRVSYNFGQVINGVGNSPIFVINRVRVLGIWLHTPTKFF